MNCRCLGISFQCSRSLLCLILFHDAALSCCSFTSFPASLLLTKVSTSWPSIPSSHVSCSLNNNITVDYYMFVCHLITFDGSIPAWMGLRTPVATRVTTLPASSIGRSGAHRVRNPSQDRTRAICDFVHYEWNEKNLTNFTSNLIFQILLCIILIKH